MWFVTTYSDKWEAIIGTHVHLCVCTCGEPGFPCQDNVPHILGKSMFHLPSGSHVGVAPDLTSVWSSLHSPHTQSHLPTNKRYSEQTRTKCHSYPPSHMAVKKLKWRRNGSDFTKYHSNVQAHQVCCLQVLSTTVALSRARCCCLINQLVYLCQHHPCNMVTVCWNHNNWQGFCFSNSHLIQ